MNNTETIQAAYAAFGSGDIPGLLSHLDPNVQWDHAGPDTIPWAGSFRGHDGVVKFFTAIGENADFISFEPRAFVAEGEKVIVLGHESIKHKGTGRGWETDWTHAFTLKDGKVTSFREYTDTATIADACRS